MINDSLRDIENFQESSSRDTSRFESDVEVVGARPSLKRSGDRASIVLGLRSHECFCVDTTSFPASTRQSLRTLRYDLEKYLPIDAEQMAVDMSVGLIVIVDRDRILPSVKSAEVEGYWIAGVSPVVLLAADALLREQNLDSSLDIFWQCDDGNGWDYLEIRDRQAVLWHWGELGSLIGKRSENDESPIAVKPPILCLGNLTEQQLRRFDDAGKVFNYRPGRTQHEYASKTTDNCIKGIDRPWIDLRGEHLPTLAPMAPIGHSLMLIASVIVFCLGLGLSAILWKSYEYAEIANESDTEREQVFRDLLPGQPVPTDIVGRLRSECRKLIAASQQLSKEPPIHQSLPTLIRTLNSLPKEATFRIDSIRVVSSQISNLDGAVRSLDDSEKIVKALRSAGYQFMPPGVSQMADGFAIHIEKLIYQAPKPSTPPSQVKKVSQN